MLLFLQSIAAMLLGIFCGIITGLLPGIHINLVVTILIGSSAFLLMYTEPVILCTGIIALSITHQFLEFIPSIFIGAPDPSTALSVLPGHRYLLRGNGLMGLKLAVIGCFFGILSSAVLLYPIILLLPRIFSIVKDYMPWFLGVIIISMILQNRNKFWAIFIFMLSGLAGLLVFNIPVVKEPLFPLLSGLFGTATLIISINEKNNLPEQKNYEGIKIKRAVMWKALASGQFSALLTALFPGISPAIAAVFGMQLTKKIGDHGYMILQGCINASGFLLSIATLYSINKARNGAVVGIQQLIATITREQILFFVTACIIAAACAVPLTLFIGKNVCNWINKINYKAMIYTVITFITILVFIRSSWIGLLILITTTAIGIIPGLVKVTRTQAMGCLILPVLLYYVI